MIRRVSLLNPVSVLSLTAVWETWRQSPHTVGSIEESTEVGEAQVTGQERTLRRDWSCRIEEGSARTCVGSSVQISPEGHEKP